MESEPTASSRSALDLGVVALLVLAAAVLFTQVELNEWLFERTRHLEALQVDEAPATLFVLATGMSWFAWRRYREARTELGKRQAAEQRLALLLLENRRLAQQYLDAQEAERKSVARELHDELGQYLNAIKTDAVSIQEQVSEPQATVVSAIIRHIDHLHAVVRDLIRELRPVALDELGLQAALEYLLEQRQQRMPTVRFEVALEGDLDTLGETLSLTLYRLTQEALTNVSRHSRAKHVSVRVARTGSAADGSDAVTFSVVDAGRGADPSQSNGGLGLIGMRERVEMLGGQWQVTTGRDQGFSLLARIPVGDQKGATA
ncbi:sensor histidine kinase [Steroidobacter sp. S1-65]|uniref:histidine kinase n=1 Tax=Steroidobacter gossypii TaxID=2805490 RepID=A0ABS1WWU9_9GAMM|nr:sensor histidine kinase [Steroidobacter gossypii]MBM0105446.1 sensor histidine kinase [Steroidobacter gossypii]